MYPQGRHPAPHQPGQPGFKFTVAESCDRIKDEFQFLQAQYHSLKVEYDKLANEKTEMQRHYVMVSVSDLVTAKNIYKSHWTIRCFFIIIITMENNRLNSSIAR
uniref:Groucho/TLE N-terminal Q-rich domain-containing protein n=1 Tax=Periophthalmus magnuspinnatus TaxID=409849 RepID=A0A3B4B4N4_9GOBI